MKVAIVVLAVFCGLVGYAAALYLAMRVGLWQYDNYMYYTGGPMGYVVGIAGTLVPWVAYRLAKRGN